MSNIGKTYEVRGWVRTVRDQKTFAFVDINDGSTLAGLQAVLQVLPPRTYHPHCTDSLPSLCCRCFPCLTCCRHRALRCHRAASLPPPVHRFTPPHPVRLLPPVPCHVTPSRALSALAPTRGRSRRRWFTPPARMDHTHHPAAGSLAFHAGEKGTKAVGFASEQREG